jgi:hypothetical protein
MKFLLNQNFRAPAWMMRNVNGSDVAGPVRLVAVIFCRSCSARSGESIKIGYTRAEDAILEVADLISRYQVSIS